MLFVLSGFSRSIKNVRLNNIIFIFEFLASPRPKTLFALPVANPRTKNFWPSLAYASQAEHVQACFCKNGAILI